MARRPLEILARVALVPLLFAAGIALRVAWSGRGRVIAPADAPAQPLIVVLGAKVYRGGKPSPLLEERLALAESLWRARGGRILLTGDGREGPKDETRAMRQWLTARGVPGERICTDPAGYDTYESVSRLAAARPAAPVLLVSQRFHLARALYLARGAGLEARGVAPGGPFYATYLYLYVREVGARVKAWTQRATGWRERRADWPEREFPAACLARPAGEPAAP